MITNKFNSTAMLLPQSSYRSTIQALSSVHWSIPLVFGRIKHPRVQLEKHTSRTGTEAQLKVHDKHISIQLWWSKHNNTVIEHWMRHSTALPIRSLWLLFSRQATAEAIIPLVAQSLEPGPEVLDPTPYFSWSLVISSSFFLTRYSHLGARGWVGL